MIAILKLEGFGVIRFCELPQGNITAEKTLAVSRISLRSNFAVYKTLVVRQILLCRIHCAATKLAIMRIKLQNLFISKRTVPLGQQSVLCLLLCTRGRVLTTWRTHFQICLCDTTLSIRIGEFVSRCSFFDVLRRRGLGKQNFLYSRLFVAFFRDKAFCA